MGKSRWFWAIFALFLGVRLWAFAAGDNGIDFHHNAFDRPLYVERQVARGDFRPDPVYPPVHFYLLAALRLVSADLEYAPRLLSLLCALLSFVPLWRLARRWFGDAAASWAGVAYALFPLGVRVAVVSLEVAPYLLFLALAFERLAAAWQTRATDRRAEWSGVFWLSLAAATRFEGWIFLPLVALLALGRDRAAGWRTLALCGVFPIAWLGYQWWITGRPFYFLAVSGEISRVHMAAVPLAERLLAWPRIVLGATNPLVALAALGSFLLPAARRNGGWLILLFAVSLVVFTARTALGAAGFNETKYAAALGLMLLPFAGLGAATILAKTAADRRPLGAAALALACGAISLFQIAGDNVRFRADPDLRAVAAWLAENRGDRAVVIGTRDQGYLFLVGRIPPPARLLASTDAQTGRIDLVELQKALHAPGDKLLIYDTIPDGMDFFPVLKLPPAGEADALGCHFTPLRQQGPYTIYAVRDLP